MKKLTVFLLLLSGAALANSGTQRLKDSLRQETVHSEGRDKLVSYQRLTNIYFVESQEDSLKMDTLLVLYGQMIDEARRQNDTRFQGLAMANTLSAFSNRHDFDEILRRAPDYLDLLEKSEVWTYYFSVCRTFVEAYLMSNRYEMALEEAKKMYEKANGLGNGIGVGLALYMMSNAYRDMQRNGESEKYMRQSIEVLKNERGMLPYVSNAYAHLCFLLLFEERYGDVFEEAAKFEEINNRYEAESGMAQPTSWSNLYHILAKAYAGTGDYDSAELYCNKAEAINPGVIHEIEKADIWSQIYTGRKQYAQALEMLDRAIALKGDTQDTETRVKIPEKKSEILALMGRYEEAYTLYGDVYRANDSIRNIEFNARLDELRTVYEVDKLEKENEIITIEKRRNRNYFLFALGGCLLLAVALGIWMYYSRKVVRKNRGLYRQIEEQDFLTETLEREREKNLNLQQKLKSFSAPFREEDVEDETFARLSLLMKEKSLYTGSEVKRGDIAAQIGISDRRLHDCIKNSTGMSFTEYINSLRLSCSRELLAQKGDKLTIDAIAAEAGFSSRATYYRLFREKYGLSPEEFRKLTK
jgi:AraC-like DNA-binding protein